MNAPRIRGALRALSVVVLLCAASQAQALSLGEARVTSGLNAPLVAEIQILDATPAELAALRADIPGRDVFTRYGIDWPAFLTTATVKLRSSASGAPVLVVRTEQAVSEPFITLLVSADWGRGRVLREFNLIVDRPAETAEALEPMEVQAPSIDAGRSGTVDRAPAPTPAAAESAPPAGIVIADSAAPKPAPRGADSVAVRRGDTLYGIADRLARGTGASTSQVMVGLYRANGAAFGASMNELRAGAVLRVPDLAELAALPPSLVRTEVGRAVAAWRNRGGTVARAADPGGRLRLVAPSAVAVGTGGTKNARLAAAGQADPAAPAGDGAKGTSETTEQRLARVEQELLEKQRLLEVTSTQLAELQDKAAASPEAGTGLVATLSKFFGRAWWLWVALLLAVLALVGLLMGVRRRAAAAEAELQAWSSAPRREVETTPAAATRMPIEEPAAVPSAPAGSAAPPTAAVDDYDDLEGDAPILEEAGSKIDLARAFVEMGDVPAARAELEAVLRIGNDAQRQEARRLLNSLA